MKKFLLCSSALSLIGALSVFASDPSVSTGPDQSDTEVDGALPNGKIIHELNPHFGKLHANRPRGGSGISYHGGPLILNGNKGGVNVYVIWYGNWSGNAQMILTDFLNSEGGSAYYNINTTYYNGSGTHVINAITYSGFTTDNYSLGTSLTDAQIQAVVSSAITSKRLPPDVNGLYFVLTSSDVTASSGFCTQYCGWHTHGSINGTDIKYAFVGNPDRCPSACEQQSTSSPNDNPGADGMASVMAHELEEAVSDPDLNAWYDTRGAENADKCAWTFGTTYTVANGSIANMKLGTRDFLIQQNWVNLGSGYCALSH